MALNILSDLVDNVKDLDFGTGYTFEVESFPEIPQYFSLNETWFELRQRFETIGLVDNLIIHLPKEESLAFGMWILGACFQKKFKRYFLQTRIPDSAIKEVWIDLGIDDSHNSHPDLSTSLQAVELNKFNWTARNVEDFAEIQRSSSSPKILMFVTNSAEDVFTMQHFQERDILVFRGDYSEARIIAEFFLNFGLSSSDVNYEYIKYEISGGNLASAESCELRAELISNSEFGCRVN